MEKSTPDPPPDEVDHGTGTEATLHSSCSGIGERRRMLQLGIRWFTETAGGAARYYYHLVAELAALDIDVRGLVLGSQKAAQETGGRISAFADDRMSFTARMGAARGAVRQMLREFRPELIASHFAMFAFPAIDLIRRYPYVVHFHGPWAAEARAEGAGPLSVLYKRAMESVVYRQADRFVVLSDAFRRILVDVYGVREDRVRVIPGGVEVARFSRSESRTEARMVLGWPTDRPIVLTARRLAHRMGLGNLIEAMGEVRRRVPDALLLIAGKGPMLPVLEAQVANLQLADHVRFLGFISDATLPLAYRASDLTIMPTRELEGFGLAAVESLAAGTPVLVTPVGGLPEVVRGLDPQLVLDGYEPAPIADGLVHALCQLSMLPSSERCTRFARQTYDWPIIAARVREVYGELL